MKAIKVALTMILATTLGAFGLASLTGCANQSSGQSSSENSSLEDIVIKQSGYSVTADGKLRYVFVAENPNEGQLASNVVFSVEAYDQNNKMLAGAGTTVAYMYPGAQTPGAGETELYVSGGAGDAASAANAVSYIQITPAMNNVTWSKTTVTGSALEGEASIVDFYIKKNMDKSVDVKAALVSKKQGAKYQVLAVLYNGEDNPVCGSEPQTIEPKADEETYLDLKIANAPEYTDAKVFIVPASAL